MAFRRCDSERGWASIEFALIAPAVVFLAFVLGAVVIVSGDRARLITATHAAALAAMRGEPAAAITAAAAADLPSMQLLTVTRSVTQAEALSLVRVCVTARRRAPHPFSAVSVTWRECAVTSPEP